MKATKHREKVVEKFKVGLGYQICPDTLFSLKNAFFKLLLLLYYCLFSEYVQKIYEA